MNGVILKRLMGNMTYIFGHIETGCMGDIMTRVNSSGYRSCVRLYD
jgi:hypothetical protein